MLKKEVLERQIKLLEEINTKLAAKVDNDPAISSFIEQNARTISQLLMASF